VGRESWDSVINRGRGVNPSAKGKHSDERVAQNTTPISKRRTESLLTITIEYLPLKGAHVQSVTAEPANGTLQLTTTIKTDMLEDFSVQDVIRALLASWTTSGISVKLLDT
jgi:hypothetical protein